MTRRTERGLHSIPAVNSALRRAALVLLGTALGGCLQRSLPLPPPSVTSQAFTACPASQCPSGGVVVTLEGVAQPNAQVIIEDSNPNAHAATGEALGGSAVASPTGAWRAVVLPIPVGGAVLAVQPGDELNVFQILPPPSNEVSSSRFVTVPR